MNIGFIGLGNMGSGMADNLLNHCNNSNDNLIVLDINETVLSDFIAKGAINGESTLKMCPHVTCFLHHSQAQKKSIF